MPPSQTTTCCSWTAASASPLRRCVVFELPPCNLLLLTALQVEANKAILAASVEARSACWGIGLVKLMGRSSGFIACEAAIASGDVDVCLVPEAPFKLDRLLPYLLERVQKRGHATVVIAEGAAQDLMRAELAERGEEVPADYDPSGNPVLLDNAPWLKAKIKAYAMEQAGMKCDIKLIAPAYSASCW